jgi:transitional endoplasmic reticulum ATPase
LSWVNAPVQAANRQTTKQHAQPTVLSVAEKKARAKKIWEDLILDEKVKDELIELALHFDSGSLAASKGLLLYGPPGTGKTLIARKLSETMGAEFFPVTVADLKGPHIGHTAERTKAIWAKALAAPKAVLFVDECEGAFGARGAAGVDQFTEELVQTFISQWDGFSKQRNVWVVGATNLRDKIDAAVLSRFGEEVQIPLPGSRERVKIFQQELAKKGIRGPLPAETEELTQGFSGRDLENIAGRIARKCEAAGGVTLEILEAVTRNKRAQGSTASDSNATWDRLVLPEQTLQTLKNTAELFKHAEEFEKMNISMPRGILLYGPAGTGKTQIARTLAKESGLQFIAATTGDLKANYLGQSANKVKMLFERARGCAPCILFIDELDIVAPDRGSRGNDALTQEIVGQLLQELDGVKSVAGKIFLLGATNLLDSIDSAIRSRFPTHIEIPPPDEEGIAALLRVFLGKKPINFDLEAASRVMAKGMVGFSGRDIRSIVERAEQSAVGRAIKAGKPQSAEITLVDLHAALPNA